MADIKLTGLKESFGAVDIIKGVDIDIKHGAFVVSSARRAVARAPCCG